MVEFKNSRESQVKKKTAEILPIFISAAFLHTFQFLVTKKSAEILRKNGQQNFCSFSRI